MKGKEFAELEKQAQFLRVFLPTHSKKGLAEKEIELAKLKADNKTGPKFKIKDITSLLR